MIVRDLLASGARHLAAAAVPEPAGDARRLLAAALGIEAQRLTLVSAEAAPDGAEERFTAMLERRTQRQPVSQIVGARCFWGRDFMVTTAVLDPRPETECLIALALDGPEPGRVLDLGTGSGALLVTLLAEHPAASGRGTDLSPAALAVARANAVRHGVEERAEFVHADWLTGERGVYDLVVCNPPYIPRSELSALAPEVRAWEPHEALTPGPTGLESYTRIVGGLADRLAPGGRALFEIGGGQGSAVAEIFQGAGLADVRLHPDLDGRDRIVSARRTV